MFDSPKTLHPLHLFEADGVLYAADIEKARVIELSTVMADILELAETQTNEEIVQTLKTSYIEDDILEAFERFEELEKEGVLFNRGESLTETRALESERRKLLVAIPGISVDSFFDIETLYAGTNMALSYMFQHLTQYVDLHFAGNQNRKLADNVYEVDISVADFGRLSRSINETYFVSRYIATTKRGYFRFISIQNCHRCLCNAMPHVDTVERHSIPCCGITLRCEILMLSPRHLTMFVNSTQITSGIPVFSIPYPTV